MLKVFPKFFHCPSMQRFVSMRSSSPVDLDSSSLDDVRTERPAIALSTRQAAAVARTPELAAALGTCFSSPPPSAPAWCPLTAASLVATRRNHRPSCATGSSTFCYKWKTVQRLYPRMFDGINHSTPYRWKRTSSRAAPLGRKTLLSPADVTQLSEHILRVTNVLCGLTIHSLVLDWLDAEGHDVRPGREWVRQLLRRVRLSFKKPAKCVKELHSPVQHHANTHRLFIKLCWLVDKHAVSADRVVNIDETSRRLLPVQQIGWGRRGVKQAQLQDNAKEATTFTVDRGVLDMLVQIVRPMVRDLVDASEKMPPASHLSVSLSVVSRVGCPVCSDHQVQAPDNDKPCFFAMASKKVWTQCDFCAVPRMTD